MALRILMSLLTMVVLAIAQRSGKVIKDDKGRCQMTVLADATAALHTAVGPNIAYSMDVQHEPEKHKVLSPAEIKQMHYSNALENTASRIWVEQDPQVAGPDRRTWFVYVPTATGRCLGSITFKPGTPEGPLKAVAASLTAIK
jgi:hypothetical protein